MATQFEFDIGADRYQATKLDAMNQGKLLKRILPLIPPLVPLYLALPNEEAQSEDAAAQGEAPKKEKEESPADIAKVLQLAGPFADSLSSVKDEDFEWILSTCLASVKLYQEDRFMPFWNRQAKRSMFMDREDISVLLPIVVNVIQENLSRFFTDAVTGQRRRKTTA